MHHFIFRCPVTTASVQGSCRNDPCPGPYYVAQHCTACGGLHLVNPLTGKLLAEEGGRSPDHPLHPGSNPVQSGPEKEDAARSACQTLPKWDGVDPAS
jgi:hypothetical protein